MYRFDFVQDHHLLCCCLDLLTSTLTGCWLFSFSPWQLHRRGGSSTAKSQSRDWVTLKKKNQQLDNLYNLYHKSTNSFLSLSCRPSRPLSLSFSGTRPFPLRWRSCDGRAYGNAHDNSPPVFGLKTQKTTVLLCSKYSSAFDETFLKTMIIYFSDIGIDDGDHRLSEWFFSAYTGTDLIAFREKRNWQF